jgi:hypothetical protein
MVETMSEDHKDGGSPRHHITVKGNANFSNANFSSAFSATKDSSPVQAEKESLVRFYMKNPDKLRDMMIILFLIYSMLKGTDLKSMMELIKGK